MSASDIGAGVVPRRKSAYGLLQIGQVSGERLLWAVLALFIITVSIVPLIYAADAAFYVETRTGLSSQRSLRAVLEVYGTAEYLGYFANALILAALVTITSLGAGLIMAVIVARTDIPAKKTFDLLIIMPLFLSPFIGLISWIVLGSEKTGFINVAVRSVLLSIGIESDAIVNIWNYTGVVWVLFLFFCPFAYLFTVGALRGMDSSLEEAARTNGATSVQTLLRITIPMTVPAIFASGLLIFILAAEMYTIPGIIGASSGFTTLPWRIYQDSTVFPLRQAHAAAAGTMLLWVTLFGLWLQREITRKSERFVTVTGKGFRGRPLALGPWRWPAIAFICAYVFCAVVLPLTALLISSFMKYSASTISTDLLTLDHYRGFFGIATLRLALWNTVLLAVLCGAVCVVVGFVVSFMEIRRPSRLTSFVSFLGVIPIAVPGLVYGLGLLWFSLQTSFYGTIWILLLAFIAKFLPYGILISRSGILQIHPELEQSARVCGATALQALMAILMPLVKPTLISIMVFVMLQVVKELSASLFLYSQRSEVLSVLTWHYVDSGEYQFASVIGVVQTLLMIGLVVVTRSLFRVELEKAMTKT